MFFFLKDKKLVLNEVNNQMYAVLLHTFLYMKVVYHTHIIIIAS